MLFMPLTTIWVLYLLLNGDSCDVAVTVISQTLLERMKKLKKLKNWLKQMVLFFNL